MLCCLRTSTASAQRLAVLPGSLPSPCYPTCSQRLTAGQMRVAKLLMSTCSCAAVRTREVNANLVCLNAAISACEKHGAWMEALDLLAILGSECIVRKKSATTAPYHSHSFVPRRQFGDTTSFNTAISACSSGFAWLSLVEWWCFRST